MGIPRHVRLGIPERPGQDLAEPPPPPAPLRPIIGRDVPQSLPQASHRAGHVDDFGSDYAAVVVAQFSYFHQGVRPPRFRIIGRRCLVPHRRFAFGPVVGTRRAADFRNTGLLSHPPSRGGGIVTGLGTMIGTDSLLRRRRRRRFLLLLLLRLLLGFQESARPSAAAPARRSRRTLLLLPVLLLLPRFGRSPPVVVVVVVAAIIIASMILSEEEEGSRRHRLRSGHLHELPVDVDVHDLVHDVVGVVVRRRRSAPTGRSQFSLEERAGSQGDHDPASRERRWLLLPPRRRRRSRRRSRRSRRRRRGRGAEVVDVAAAAADQGPDVAYLLRRQGTSPEEGRRRDVVDRRWQDRHSGLQVLRARWRGAGRNSFRGGMVGPCHARTEWGSEV